MSDATCLLNSPDTIVDLDLLQVDLPDAEARSRLSHKSQASRLA
jgi:hypothetical protein